MFYSVFFFFFPKFWPPSGLAPRRTRSIRRHARSHTPGAARRVGRQLSVEQILKYVSFSFFPFFLTRSHSFSFSTHGFFPSLAHPLIIYLLQSSTAKQSTTSTQTLPARHRHCASTSRSRIIDSFNTTHSRRPDPGTVYARLSCASTKTRSKGASTYRRLRLCPTSVRAAVGPRISLLSVEISSSSHTHADQPAIWWL